MCVYSFTIISDGCTFIIWRICQLMMMNIIKMTRQMPAPMSDSAVPALIFR